MGGHDIQAHAPRAQLHVGKLNSVPYRPPWINLHVLCRDPRGVEPSPRQRRVVVEHPQPGHEEELLIQIKSRSPGLGTKISQNHIPFLRRRRFGVTVSPLPFGGHVPGSQVCKYSYRMPRISLALLLLLFCHLSGRGNTA